MTANRYAIRTKSGRLWRFRGKVQTFASPLDAAVWLAEDSERVVAYKPRRKKSR